MRARTRSSYLKPLPRRMETPFERRVPLAYRGTPLIRNAHPPRITRGPSRHGAIEGSYGGGGPYERGTPVK